MATLSLKTIHLSQPQHLDHLMTPPLPPLVGVPVVGKTVHPGVALLLLQESLELDSLVLELMSSLMSWNCPEAAPAL